jgi:hypothetical protein
MAQSELSKRREVALLEEAAEGLANLVGHVHLALVETLNKFLRGDVNDLYLVGVVDQRVWNRLRNDDAGDLGDDVVEALNVLDIDRCVDVNSLLKQFRDRLPTLFMARARNVGVGKLIHKYELRLSR